MEKPKANTERREFYNKYRKSEIFSQPTLENTNTKQLLKNKIKNDFIPKYKNINKTCIERYNEQLGYKTKTIKRSNTNGNLLKKNNNRNTLNSNLKASDIMCRDMYNNCDVKKYIIKRNKSMFIKRTVNTKIKNDANSRIRKVDSMKSNIFFDKGKENINKSSINNIKSDFKKEICNIDAKHDTKNYEKKAEEKRLNYKHSRFSTNTDWKNPNTETHKKNNINSNLNKSNFSRRYTLQNENINTNNNIRNSLCSESNKKGEKFTNIDSVDYDIITGKKSNEKNKLIKEFSENIKSGNISLNNKNDNFQTEYYELIVSKNFDKTDVNIIKNYFVNNGIHLFKLKEKSDNMNNKSGKITFRIRKDKNDKDYDKKISSINNLISNKDMKLNKIDNNLKIETKAKKTRQKTPGNVLRKEQLKTTTPKIKKTNTIIQYDRNYKNYTNYLKGKK